MVEFHAVLLDETRCEFGVTLEAASVDDAHKQLEEDYPECRVEQVLTTEQLRERQRARECRLYSELEYDMEYPNDYEEGY